MSKLVSERVGAYVSGWVSENFSGGVGKLVSECVSGYVNE